VPAIEKQAPEMSAFFVYEVRYIVSVTDSAHAVPLPANSKQTAATSVKSSFFIIGYKVIIV
jgi:hypothetical protein